MKAKKNAFFLNKKKHCQKTNCFYVFFINIYNLKKEKDILILWSAYLCYILIIIYHDFLPTPRRGSHVKSGKTHTQSSRYTP